MIINKPIILFDGVCNLCNNSVQFVIKHDKKEIFQFAALQSNTGQALLLKHQMQNKNFDSFILIQNDKVLTKSTAALMVAKQLSGLIKCMYIFIIIPSGIRNVVYNFIAKNRYKWFGKKDSCMVPSAALKSRFLN